MIQARRQPQGGPVATKLHELISDKQLTEWAWFSDIFALKENIFLASCASAQSAVGHFLQILAKEFCECAGSSDYS